MAVCGGFKRNGAQCTATVEPPQRFCWWHDPANKEERRKAAAKGGKGKAHRKITALWDEVEKVIAGVESERLSPPQGNTMIRGYGTLISLARLDVEQAELEIAQRRLELDEQERLELLSRIESLEETERLRKERSRFGT